MGFGDFTLKYALWADAVLACGMAAIFAMNWRELRAAIRQRLARDAQDRAALDRAAPDRAARRRRKHETLAS
jgi:hypothetical protein